MAIEKLRSRFFVQSQKFRVYNWGSMFNPGND